MLDKRFYEKAVKLKADVAAVIHNSERYKPIGSQTLRYRSVHSQPSFSFRSEHH